MPYDNHRAEYRQCLFFPGKIRLKSNKVSQIILRGFKLRKKFFRNRNFVRTRDNFNILNFEVETKVLASLAYNDREVVRRVVLTVMYHQFDLTVFTDHRKVCEVVDCSSLKKTIKLRTLQNKININCRQFDRLVGRRYNNTRISKEILRFLSSLFKSDIAGSIEVQFRFLKKIQGIEKLTKVIDTNKSFASRLVMRLLNLPVSCVIFVMSATPFVKSFFWCDSI